MAAKKEKITMQPIGLSTYSFPFTSGGLGRGTPRACPNPFDAWGLMNIALQAGLNGVEVAPMLVSRDLDPEALAAYKEAVEAKGLAIVADTGMVDVEQMQKAIPAACAIGADVLRATVSHILCGERCKMNGEWPAHFNEIIRRLQQVRPIAEEYGVTIAIENHQDVTSADMLEICERVGGSNIGVTLDVVNPLAVGEDPIEFAERVAPFIRNVHLKDYYIYLTPQGYRLIRSPLGAGVMDFPALFNLLAEKAPNAYLNIELAAQNERHIRIHDQDWWTDYPAEHREQVKGGLVLAEKRGRRGDDWQTRWERGEDCDAIKAGEMQDLEESVEYLRSIGKLA